MLLFDIFQAFCRAELLSAAKKNNHFNKFINYRIIDEKLKNKISVTVCIKAKGDLDFLVNWTKIYQKKQW